MTKRYDALWYISTYYTFTNGSTAFDTLQLGIPHITVHNICRHILITFVTVLHLITAMNIWVGIYKGTVAFYRDLTRVTVSDIKSEWTWYHVSPNNIRKNVTGLAGTMHYDTSRRITRLQTVLLHSIHGSYEFRMLQYIIFVNTYISRLWLYYTLLHLNDPLSRN